MAVENRIKIGDFVKLTGSTLKTVNYYHKIGLLPAPQRTDGGYRLYGLEELNRFLSGFSWYKKHLQSQITSDWKCCQQPRSLDTLMVLDG
jgi:hypothetical protein